MPSLLVLLPAVPAVLLLLHGRIPALRWGVALASLASFVIALALPWDSVRVVEALPGVEELGYGFSWRLDAFRLSMAALVAGIGAMVTAYASAYFGATPKGVRALGLLGLFESAMLGLVLADNLFAAFVFWELTSICSFFLVAIDADKRADAFPAARRALLLTVGGGLALLAGLVQLFVAGGTASITELIALQLPSAELTAPLVLILIGAASKSAIFPLHFWLPGAMAAPSPISAYLHSATMVKAGLFLLLAFYPIFGGGPVWQWILVPLGVIGCLWGSYRALGQDDAKLLLAWSTVSQLGLIALTLGLGTEIAVRAALLHVYAHALFKAGLFLGVGVVDKATGTRKFSELGGLRRHKPVLFGSFVLLAGSMAGLPPLAGFLSKELILKKSLYEQGPLHWIAVGGIVLGAIGTVAYSVRLVGGIFMEKARSQAAEQPKNVYRMMHAMPFVLAGLSLFAGLSAPFIDRILLEPAVTALLGKELETAELALWYGINLPLILSVSVLVLGTLFERRLGMHFLPKPEYAPSGGAVFDDIMAGLVRKGRFTGTLLARLRPSHYFGMTLVIGLIAALPLIGTLPSPPRGGELGVCRASWCSSASRSRSSRSCAMSGAWCACCSSGWSVSSSR
jgi:NADH:ubiquinone oxidoreductase subunit 5 (subunit L)/multisubunit Na+/H+ antiporter MnhA subunit